MGQCGCVELLSCRGEAERRGARRGVEEVRREQHGSVATGEGMKKVVLHLAPGHFENITNRSLPALDRNCSTVFDLSGAFKHFQKLCQFLGSLFILI